MSEEKELKTIVAIAKRAEEMDLLMFGRHSLIMDLKIANKKYDLKLVELLNTDNFNFSHDVIGIQQNIDRQNKKMENIFLPRFAKQQ